MRILVDPAIFYSEKLKVLADALGISKDSAACRLMQLWGWAVNFREDGNLSGLTPQELATASGWSDNPNKFVETLCTLGWINSDDFTIHDWLEHQGALIRKRKQSRELMRKHRQLANHVITTVVPTVTTTVRPALPCPSVPCPSLPLQLKSKETSPAPPRRRVKAPPAEKCRDHWPIWRECYRDVYHEWPERIGEDLAASKRLGNLYTDIQLVGLYQAFLRDQSDFLTTRRHPLRYLSNSINRYAQEGRIHDEEPTEPDLCEQEMTDAQFAELNATQQTAASAASTVESPGSDPPA